MYLRLFLVQGVQRGPKVFHLRSVSRTGHDPTRVHQGTHLFALLGGEMRN